MPNDDTPPISRHAFLAQALGQLGGLVNESLSSLTDLLPTSVKSTRFRPPGALREAMFVSTCDTDCHACLDSCPKHAIHRDAHGFPVLDVNDTPCVMCTDVPCTRVCPTGALAQLESPTAIGLGLASIDTMVCTAYRGSGCRVCYDTCPIQGMAIVMTEGLPHIMDTACTGCGVCVSACPTPEAITVYPLS